MIQDNERYEADNASEVSILKNKNRLSDCNTF
jgi:hypothetical protein